VCGAMWRCVYLTRLGYPSAGPPYAKAQTGAVSPVDLKTASFAMGNSSALYTVHGFTFT